MNEFNELSDFRKIRQLRKVLREFDAGVGESAEEKKRVIAELRVAERKLTYKYDLWAFLLEVLDAERRGETPVKLARVHRELARFVRRCKNIGTNCVIRLPRYHLKTQICTIYYRIWRIVNNPELCSLIVSGTLDLSKDTCRAIRYELTNNKKIRALYPQIVPDWLRNERKNKWTETEFNVARAGNYAQCTLEAVGVDATVTGKHFGELGFDDIVTRENSTTPEQCAKVIKAYRFFLSIVNSKKARGKIPIMVVGTNYTDHDLYTFLETPEVRESFKQFVQPVFDENNEPIWKEQHTKESLLNIQNQQGSYIFSTQYLLDPVPEDQQEIKRTWIQTYYELPRDVNGHEIVLEKMIFVDPITAKKTASTSHDRGVVLVAGWDKRRNIYVLDYKLYTRAKESELFDGIFEMSDKWGTKFVGWESVAYQLQGIYNLEEKSQQYGKALKVTELKPGHAAKDVRIRVLIPHFERGQFYIRHWMHELVTELVRFPHGKTKDIIDVLAYVLRHVMGKKAGVGSANGFRLGSSDNAWYL
jgi:phage terminase large subunit-like protein